MGRNGHSPYLHQMERIPRVQAPAQHMEPFLLKQRAEVAMIVDTVVERVRAEFEEMPGMKLTVPQASRLFGLEEDICRTIVERLVHVAYLRRTETGAITRAGR